MEGDWEEEETCPRALPLTLTGITKGPKNKGQEKEVEIEEEARNDRGNEQAHLENPNSREIRKAEELEPYLECISR